MQIAIIGTGYVGLVTGTCLADAGNHVTCVDIDPTRISELQRGHIPIYEPGLTELATRNAQAERLVFTTDYASAVPSCDMCFIAVGTPQIAGGSADLQYVLNAARSIAEHMDRFLIVVDKSTVPVGTAVVVEREMRARTSHPVAVVSNPEFLKEGAAINDFATPDRVIVGYDARGEHAGRVRTAMEELYHPFVDQARPLVFMNRESAELTKYAANAMLATRISFMNEIANICERTGADVLDVSHGIGLDARIGPKFLKAGLGYGGSCFPKDVRALARISAEVDYDFQIAHAVDRVNELQKRKLTEGVVQRFGEDLSGKMFAVLGLAFKPETDDMREAPSIVTVDGLLKAGATLQVFDPEAQLTFQRLAEDTWSAEQRSRVKYAAHAMNALDGVDGLLLVTEWKLFLSPDWSAVKRRMRTPVVFDGRNLYDRETLETHGFEYFGIGT